MLPELLALPFTQDLLGAIITHDYNTHRHLLNVAILLAQCGRSAGFSDLDAIALGRAGLFHDIGKVRIPEQLLNAPRSLNDEEMRTMRAHATIGEAILRAHDQHELATIVRGHHERLDGSGYPDGRAAAAISWPTRILAVVDSYDAMRSGRPYAAGISHTDAMNRLNEATHLFDRDAIAVLETTLRKREVRKRDALIA
jgi:putative nucleotidyltransferase with HDIG domain